MGKILKEKYLHWFSKDIVYITISELVKDEPMYCLNVWDYDNECLKCILSLDISENLDDIISDLETVCQEVVIEFEDRRGESMIYRLITSFGDYEDSMSCEAYVESNLNKNEFERVVEEIKSSTEYKNLHIGDVWKRLKYVETRVLARDDCFKVEISSVFLN